uniref:Uncharacterized protein n=1 Tax=Romanomermis culicivorax TaxID=13658 RepID=A0A915L783_ROMCU
MEYGHPFYQHWHGELDGQDENEDVHTKYAFPYHKERAKIKEAASCLSILILTVANIYEWLLEKIISQSVYH